MESHLVDQWPYLTSNLQSLAHHQAVASFSLINRYTFGFCFCGLPSSVSIPVTFVVLLLGGPVIQSSLHHQTSNFFILVYFCSSDRKALEHYLFSFPQQPAIVLLESYLNFVPNTSAFTARSFDYLLTRNSNTGKCYQFCGNRDE